MRNQPVAVRNVYAELFLTNSRNAELKKCAEFRPALRNLPLQQQIQLLEMFIINTLKKKNNCTTRCVCVSRLETSEQLYRVRETLASVSLPLNIYPLG